MTLTVISCLVLWGILSRSTVMAAPTIQNRQAQLSFELASAERQDRVFQKANPTMLHVDEVYSLLLPPPTETSPSTTTSETATENRYPFSFSYATAEASSTVFEPTATITVIEEEPITITEDRPTTITDFITITPLSVSPSSSSAASTTTTPDDGLGSTQKVWAAPDTLNDLASFQVSKYAGGEKNMKIVTGIPAEASARPVASGSSRVSQTDESPVQWDNASWALQLLYPEDSIDPGQHPQGGAEFYASPIDISNAQSVTLNYSVFFPGDFDWVLGGKLPGMYGGHTGCSGGNAAIDCFSTRLMWRPDGAGELYLYAPKDKQTKALCDDPQSVCDAAYGFSVGRGSFNWVPGAWTTVQQTVVLNTPGKPDGAFLLDVNGQRKINRTDVFYREDLSGAGDDPDKAHKKKAKTTRAPTKTTTQKHAKSSSTSSDEGDVLGPILGGILGLRRRNGEIAIENVTATHRVHETRKVLLPAPTASAPEPTSTAGVTFDPVRHVNIESTKETEVKFIGIFFSTFFGGHEDKYATPRDQYVWFKDFALANNS